MYLICGANQWTGFYMITVSVMKGLSMLYILCNVCQGSQTNAYMKHVDRYLLILIAKIATVSEFQ